MVFWEQIPLVTYGYISVDHETSLAHTLNVTSAHVSDIAEAVSLLHREERFV